MHELEEKIIEVLNKSGKKGMFFSIPDIIRLLEKNEVTCSFEEISEALRILEEKSMLFSKNDEYRLFPSELGYYKGEVTIGKNNEGLIHLEDGTIYEVHPNEMWNILDGDTVIVSPTDKIINGNRMVKIVKLVKRKDGLLKATVISKNYKKKIVPINAKFDKKIILDKVDINDIRDGSTILIRLSDLESDKTYHAEFIDYIEYKEENLPSEEIAIEIEDIDKTDLVYLENFLIKFFAKFKEKKFSLKDISRKLEKVMSFKNEELEMVLTSLEEKGIIYIDDKGYYSSFPASLNFIQGIVHINKHDDGFIEIGERKYKIYSADLLDALDGDTVIIKPDGVIKNGYIMSTVEKIVKRKDGLLVTEVTLGINGEFYLRPFSARIERPIKVSKILMKNFVEGERVVVRIDDINSKGFYEAEFIESIGHKDDPDANLKVIALQNNITIDFSEAALKETDMLPTIVSEEELADRIDLRSKLIFSIDGAKTKDRDDAISLEINERGNYVVGVHISDVSHYIHPGMALWEEAHRRGTSVYMVDTVIPMLPHKISNGICSLNEGVDRLTVSCIMEVSTSGEILNFEFVDSVINSRKAMTYEDVNRVLENGETVEGYEEFYDNLVLMQRLSGILEKKKIARGYVNFGSNDLEIDVDGSGQPLEFREREEKTAEKIIENFMLLANECYATYVIIPTPLRVHESPDEEKVESAFSLLSKSGIRIKQTDDIINGKVIQQILSQIEDIEERKIAANIILRAMQRARYDVERQGHFGLGLKNYGHFTSPIRRAADLQGHYNLKMQRDNEFEINSTEEFYEIMDCFCKHISKKERDADEAEQESRLFMMIEYMARHINEKFSAHVTYINGKVIFVKTDDGIDGRLYADEIRGDRFSFNERSLSYVGKKTKKVIKIGSSLVLTVLDANHDFGSVNFGIFEEDLPLIMARRKK